MKKVRPVHPGQILLEEHMKPNGLSTNSLAKAIKVYHLRIQQIVHGERGVTPETALRLARYFGMSAEFWVRLQARYELEIARAKFESRIAEEIKIYRPTR